MTLTSTELGLLVAVIAVGGIVIGGLVAGGFAVLTGWLENRREHRRWLREERYALYLKISIGLDQIRRVLVDVKAAPDKVKAEQMKVEEAQQLAKQANELGPILNDLSPQLFILGPRKLSVSFMRCLGTIKRIAEGVDGAADEYSVLKARFVRDVQDELHAGWPWQRVTEADAFVFREIQKEGRETPASGVVETDARQK